MRLITSILIISMAIVGLVRFTGDMSLTEIRFVMSCDKDCYCHGGDCCDLGTQEDQEGHQDHQDQDEQGDQDHQCPPDCDCSYEFQLVAIEYHFMTSFVMAPKAVQYGNYTDTYHFEYFKPLFQPPRFG